MTEKKTTEKKAVKRKTTGKKRGRPKRDNTENLDIVPPRINASQWEVLGIPANEIKEYKYTDRALFCVYLFLTNGFNRAKAYRDAGYLSKQPAVEACNFFNHPNMKKLVKKAIDSIIEPLKNELFFNIIDRAAVAIKADITDYMVLATDKIDETVKAWKEKGLDTRIVESMCISFASNRRQLKITFMSFEKATDIISKYIDIAKGYDTRNLHDVKKIDSLEGKSLEELERIAEGGE